jgi:hypothetical protein
MFATPHQHGPWMRCRRSLMLPPRGMARPHGFGYLLGAIHLLPRRLHRSALAPDIRQTTPSPPSEPTYAGRQNRGVYGTHESRNYIRSMAMLPL